jgi:hypothetical protein
MVLSSINLILLFTRNMQKADYGSVDAVLPQAVEDLIGPFFYFLACHRGTLS